MAETTHALLADGRTVPLEKDCGCATHGGPHWLHVDGIDRERNRVLLAGGNDFGVFAFACEEEERLTEKGRQMESRGIARLLTEAESHRMEVQSWL